MVELSPELQAEVDAIRGRRCGGGQKGRQHYEWRPDRPRQLTPRNLEVLRLVASGKSNPEIASDLFISIETVKSHIKDVLAIVGARSRAHAVAICLRKGLIE